MLIWPPDAPVDAAGDAATAGVAAPAAGDADPAAADGALVVGAAADDACGAVVGFGAVVAVGVVEPPHAASSAPTAAALADARNRRRVHVPCRSLVAIALTPFASNE
jgi:hypothetical protein